MTTEPELNLFAAPPPVAAPTSFEVAWFVDVLRGRDWITAEALLTELGQPVVETLKRRLRALAEASEGRISSGDEGYKLTVEMTAEEFGKFDRRLANQEAKMKARRVAAHIVFYSRTNVNRSVNLEGRKA
jgi:hypothetical protein